MHDHAHFLIGYKITENYNLQFQLFVFLLCWGSDWKWNKQVKLDHYTNMD